MIAAELRSAWTGEAPVPTRPALAIRPCHQQDSHTVEDEHETQVHLGFGGRAFKLLPGKNSPESGDHRRGLPYGIRNCHAGEAGSDQIEDHADAPDESA